jgi:hypothetical protein
VKPSLRLAFIGLLTASLAGKLLANGAPPGPDPRLFEAAAVGMIRAAGFDAATERRKALTFVRGKANNCRLIVAEWDPHGTFDEFYRETARPVGPVRFAWRGDVQDSAPKAVALAQFYLWRELRRIRVAAPRAPVTVWAASPACDVRHMKWGQLASLPA